MRVTICAFIDAYGWELFRRHQILEDELQTAAPLQTVFGYSSACDPTILTGLEPQQHGHFSFFYYDKEGSELAWCRALRWLPRRLSERGRVRHWLSRVVGTGLGYTGYFQLYQVPFQHLNLLAYSERRDLYRAGGINSGAPTIFDYLRRRRVAYHCSDWRKGESFNLRALASQLEVGQIRFAYLYMAALDGILHHQGTRGPQVEAKLAWYDSQLRKILELARGNYDEVELHLFSDHGMTDVNEHVDLMASVDKLGLRFGRDYVAVYDSTMARFWFAHPGAERAIRQALTEHEEGRWLERQELRELGCLFDGDRYGEAFYLLRAGALVCPSFMGRKPVAGMHGYHPEHPDSVALFASTRRLSKPPARLLDLYGLMKEVA